MSSLAFECVTDRTIQPFIESTKSFFAMMLNADAELVLDNQCSEKVLYDISGIISFSGAVQGTAVISLDKEVAFAITETLLGARPDSVNEEVRDMVGELANMIGGNAKERLSNSEITLGLPTVVTGKGHEVSFDPGAQVRSIIFATPWGQLSIEVGMRAPKG